MSFYTIIADYCGGTYLAQATADDERQAILVWAKNFDIEIITGLSAKSQSQWLEGMQSYRRENLGPTPLDGLANVWCESFLLGDKLLLVHIVQTVET